MTAFSTGKPPPVWVVLTTSEDGESTYTSTNMLWHEISSDEDGLISNKYTPMKLSKSNWNLITGGIMGLSSILATAIVRKGWIMIKKEEPPMNHASSSVSFGQALLLTSSVAIIGGAIKLATSRWLADKWQESGGDIPNKEKVRS
jgi:hypothetical protein